MARKQLQALKAGETMDFAIRSKEGRREVHLLAAELDMSSRSFTRGQQRVVVVRNTAEPVLVEQKSFETITKERR